MKTLKLKHPITVGDKKQITELTFRDYATANDLLAFDERGSQRQTIVLVANLTGTDESIIGKLHIHDFHAADKIASDLIAPEATEKNVQES